MTSSEFQLKNSVIVIPLHLPRDYPSDYINQTAKILSAKNTVVLLDYYFPYSWKDLINSGNFKRLLSSLKNIKKSKRVIYFRAPALLPFSKFPAIIHLNKIFGYWLLSIYLLLMKKRVIIWQFFPLITKKFLSGQFFVYDCVDYWTMKQEQVMFDSCDLAVFNSKPLFEKKLRQNPLLEHKSAAVVCGCNYELYNRRDKIAPKELLGVKRKKIVLAGVFDFRLDVPLIKYIVDQNKNYAFVFVGPIDKSAEKNFERILKSRNVIYLGQKTKKELARYLAGCDLGIIPYRASNDFAAYANPMKAYEYLASGLPVVSTDIHALSGYPKDIVYTANNKKYFNEAMGRLMDGWGQNQRRRAKQIAEKNSWKNKIEIIEKSIFKYEKSN